MAMREFDCFGGLKRRALGTTSRCNGALINFWLVADGQGQTHQGVKPAAGGALHGPGVAEVAGREGARAGAPDAASTALHQVNEGPRSGLVVQCK